MSAQRPLPPDELGLRLAEVYRVVGPLYRRALRRVERDQPAMGMSVGVRAVLDELRRTGALTVPGLARRLDLSRQFVQRMVNDAHTATWVELRANPAHRRSSLVTITPAGEAAIDRVARREHELMSQVGGGLTRGEIDATLRVLGEMLAALDAVDDTVSGDGPTGNSSHHDRHGGES
ncbi:MarR family winged helix-turn-helix transcriptional regulator [Haloactinopolyspora sp.]|uniref:MarR family winged helix-turn-helix transcriptional regulator n=1 Tax=Haloactinopolyspora sp. TaxID=1966353 RepID=UPI00260D11DE|nr:MarR family winged helix-turn-helix transcriptional regulator [Haloactinopolyspora sp.]